MVHEVVNYFAIFFLYEEGDKSDITIIIIIMFLVEEVCMEECLYN